MCYVIAHARLCTGRLDIYVSNLDELVCKRATASSEATHMLQDVHSGVFDLCTRSNTHANESREVAI